MVGTRRWRWLPCRECGHFDGNSRASRFHAIATPRVSDRPSASQSVAYQNHASPYRTNPSDGNGWRFR
jgi:hypothetical protein